MKENINRILIETTVKNTLKSIRESPERSIRRLVDMACNFSGGRFQKDFFEIARQMLKNQDSKYYEWIRDVVLHADLERLAEFGMNLGYNSCTLGADRIRSCQREGGYGIPWLLSFDADRVTGRDRREQYQSVLDQGKRLGIYAFLLRIESGVRDVLSLLENNRDCAFFLSCDPKEVTKELLEEAESVKNFIFILEDGRNLGQVCRLLRKKQFLYALSVSYGEANGMDMIEGQEAQKAVQKHSSVIIYKAEEGCPAHWQDEVYRYVVKERKDPVEAVVPFEFANDIRFVGEVISEQRCCFAGFDQQGNLYTPEGKKEGQQFNCFCTPLEEILKQAFAY